MYMNIRCVYVYMCIYVYIYMYIYIHIYICIDINCLNGLYVLYMFFVLDVSLWHQPRKQC
jgi:hypothetical protein